MPKLLLPLVALLAVGGSAAGASVYLLTRDETVVEVLPSPVAEASPTAAEGSPTPTATPTAPPGGAGLGGLEGTAVPILTPFPSPPPIPTDWTTYSQLSSDKSGAFTLSHPPAWLLQGGDPTGPGTGLSIVMWSWREGKPPPNSLKVDLYVDPYRSSSCEPDGATTASLGGVLGWQVVQAYDPAISGGLVRTHRVVVDRGGFRYCVTGYFIEGVDVTTFSQLLSSFNFTD